VLAVAAAATELERTGPTPNYLVKAVLSKRALQTSVCFKSFDGLYDLRVNYSLTCIDFFDEQIFVCRNSLQVAARGLGECPSAFHNINVSW